MAKRQCVGTNFWQGISFLLIIYFLWEFFTNKNSCGIFLQYHMPNIENVQIFLHLSTKLNYNSYRIDVIIIKPPFFLKNDVKYFKRNYPRYIIWYNEITRKQISNENGKEHRRINSKDVEWKSYREEIVKVSNLTLSCLVLPLVKL